MNWFDKVLENWGIPHPVLTATNAGDITLGNFRSILDSMTNGDNEDMQFITSVLPKLNEYQLNEAIKFISTSRFQSDDISSRLEIIIPVCSTLVINIQNSNNHPIAVLSSQLLLLLASLPGATAYGFLNGTILNTISNALSKALCFELKSKPQNLPKKTVATNDAIQTEPIIVGSRYCSNILLS